MLWRENERIFRDIFEPHTPSFRQRMIAPSDEHRFVCHQRIEFDVGRRGEQWANGKINFAVA